MLYYYIMVDPDKHNHCKVGITKDPNQRIRAYRTSNPEIYFSKIYKLPHRIHERKILDLFKDICKVRSEYIHCCPTIAQNIIEGYFTDHNIDY